MPRGDQLARQWKIIQTLITSRRGKSTADLAEELECHPRTLYRDPEALQVAGFPIYTEKAEGADRLLPPEEGGPRLCPGPGQDAPPDKRVFRGRAIIS
jgi:predicted DNA-binding transcriptional regulator YafY